VTLRGDPELVTALTSWIPCPACVVDGDGTIAHANVAWRDYCLGTAHPHDGEARAVVWSAVLHPDDRDRVPGQARGGPRTTTPAPRPAPGDGTVNLAKPRAANVDHGRPQHFEFDTRVRHASGGYRWCRCVGQALDESDVTRWLVLLVDLHQHDSNDRARARGEPSGVTVPLASLAHALRNPVQALRHALYVLRLPDLPADEQRRMLMVQERQVAVLAQAIESHLAAPAAAPVDETTVVTVQSMVRAILCERGEAVGAAPHPVTVRMDDPTLELAADERQVAREVGVEWRKATARHPHASRSLLSLRRHAGHIDLELAITPEPGMGALAAPVPMLNTLEGELQGGGASPRISSGLGASLSGNDGLVYRTSIRVRPPRA
jgi:hypothetical protein